MSCLLAVDMGLKTGLALYGRDGRLVWYRSAHISSARRLKAAVYNIFRETPAIDILVIEGGGPLADIWIREANRRNVRFKKISAETWREAFLYGREQRTGKGAKKTADTLARKVIQWSGAKRPTSLRHDAAEAIMAGLWGVRDAGWLTEMPAGLNLQSRS